MTKSIVIVSPHFPPMQTGLAGHTYQLARGFADLGYTVHIITSKDNDDERLDERIKVHPIIEAWTFLHLLSSLHFIKSLRGERIIIQYLPYIFGDRAGINFGAPAAFSLFRLVCGAPVDIICHELYYPFLGGLKSAVIHISHVTMLLLLSIGASRFLCSTEKFAGELSRKIPWRIKSIERLSVGTNIPIYTPSKHRSQELRSEYSLNGLILGSFGTFHPTTRLDLILKSIESELGNDGWTFIMIGETRDRLQERVPSEVWQRCEKNIRATGTVGEEVVSSLLQLLDLYIAYFTDGISTRRGSLMAALAHGCPTIAATSEWSEAEFHKLRGLQLIPSDTAHFEAGLREGLKRLRSEGKAQAVDRNIFDGYFSWPAIIRAYWKGVK